MTTGPRPFVIRVPDEVLGDLRERLGRVRFPDAVPGAGWQYGSDLGYMKDLVAYWRDRYDWRQHEADLNAYRQFTVPLAGIDLHYIHEEGRGPRPLPLLLCHGWPGSVWEFHKLIPLLSDPVRFGGDSKDAFTVVAPSLPGFGFSFSPGQPRLGVVEIADCLAALMTQVLDYPRWGAHGGDWGCLIATRLGHAHGARLAGIHLTNAFIRPSLDEVSASDEMRAYHEETERWEREEAGYLAIQGTRPQTLAYALTDSPIGLAAWLVEKFRAFSDCGGNLERRFTKDELLTNITLYWSTSAIHSSFWVYYAHRHQPWVSSREKPITTPTGYADFPAEIVRPPQALVARYFNLRRWTAMFAGGHFAALEEPEALARDLREFFRDLR
ncbi:MAG: epoxide hydrolase family protein [Gemmatimonadaceae bacterium]